MFNMKCQCTGYIYPRLNGSNEIREAIIMGFAWSDKHQRVGCCMKDFTMSFWDAADDFKFEK